VFSSQLLRKGDFYPPLQKIPIVHFPNGINAEVEKQNIFSTIKSDLKHKKTQAPL